MINIIKMWGKIILIILISNNIRIIHILKYSLYYNITKLLIKFLIFCYIFRNYYVRKLLKMYIDYCHNDVLNRNIMLLVTEMYIVKIFYVYDARIEHWSSLTDGYQGHMESPVTTADTIRIFAVHVTPLSRVYLRCTASFVMV